MDKKVKISFSTIAHNEQHNIGRCLESIKWADEIIVVDCESTDNTVKIAEKYTKKIFHQKNNPNLNVNKSFGISKASNEWVFYIDPDEVVTEELKDVIIQIVEGNSSYSAYRMPRLNYYVFKFLKYGGNYPDYQVRLFRKNKAEFLNKHVHEKLKINGRVGTIKKRMLHYPYQSIRECINKLNFYTDFQSSFFYESGKKMSVKKLLFTLFFRANWKFFKKYIIKLGFLDGMAGLFAALTSCITLIISDYKLFEKYSSNNKLN